MTFSIDNLASQAKMYMKYLNMKQDKNIHILDGTTVENKGLFLDL